MIDSGVQNGLGHIYWCFSADWEFGYGKKEKKRPKKLLTNEVKLFKIEGKEEITSHNADRTMLQYAYLETFGIPFCGYFIIIYRC